MPGLPPDRPPDRLRAWSLAVVRGRSMLPTLREGDVLLVRGGRRAAAWAAHRAVPGRVAVVRLPGGRPVSVKRLGVRDAAGGWWVERDNPAEGVDSWQLGVPVADADVLGRVVARLWPRPSRLPAAPGSAHVGDGG